MNVRHFRTQLRSVAERWKGQYFRDGVWRESRGDASVIYEKLAALDPATASSADAAAIIGNETWTTFRCVECGQNVPIAIEYGEDYPVTLCLDCLRVAGRVAEGLKAAGI